MIHHVFANRSNVGDWLSAQGIQRLLAPLPVREYLCDEPFVPRTLAELAEATPADFIIIGGGGLFMDYFTPFWRGFCKIAERVPFCIWGVGYCDHKRESTRPPEELLQSVVRRSSLCVVRDELTKRHLSGCSLPPPVACPSMATVPAASALPGRQLLHVDHYDNVGPAAYEAMVRFAKEFAKETGRSYTQTNNRIPPDSSDGLDHTLDLYRSADLVLTSRLHGCILALAMGRKVLAVSGDHKVESFMQAAGLSDWVLDVGEVRALPHYLHSLSGQNVSPHFVQRTRWGNSNVAEMVKTLIDTHQSLVA